MKILLFIGEMCLKKSQYRQEILQFYKNQKCFAILLQNISNPAFCVGFRDVCHAIVRYFAASDALWNGGKRISRRSSSALELSHHIMQLLYCEFG